MHHKSRLVLVLFACMLSGCGGGGSGVSSGPVPVPTPTPAAYQTLDQLTGSRAFQLAGTYVERSGEASTGATFSSDKGVSIAYDQASDTYTLTAGPWGYSTALRPENRTNDAARATDNFDKRDGGTHDNGYIFRPSVSAAKLTYTTVLGWGREVSGQPTRSILAVGGIPTRAEDMPKTGSATYSTAPVVAGFTQNGVDNGARSFSSTFSADFTAGSVKTTLQAEGNGFAAGYAGTGSIASGTSGFSGALTPDAAFPGTPGAGRFEGGFFGPSAKEMAYSWYVTGRGIDGQGVVAGVRQGL